MAPSVRRCLRLAVSGCLLVTLAASALARPSEISFEVVGGHLIKLPVRLNDTENSHFILDTGIGVNLLSAPLAQRLGCKAQGSYRGQRMSGQTLELPLASLESLTLAQRRRAPIQVGLWDMSGLLPDTPDFQGVEGFLSLTYFRQLPFTLDYAKQRLILEDEASLAERERWGQSVPVDSDLDQETSLTVSLGLSLPDGSALRAEVDTGSNALILDQSFMERLGLEPDSPGVSQRQGKDETGQDFLRYFVALAGPVRLLDAPDVCSDPTPQAMFQRIVHQALIGHSFLRRYTVTWDLPRSRMIFGPSTSFKP